MKYTLYSFQLLVTCTYVELLLIYAICVVPQRWVFNPILSPSWYASRATSLELLALESHYIAATGMLEC